MTIREAIAQIPIGNLSEIINAPILPEYMKTIFKNLNRETYTSLHPDEQRAVNRLYTELSKTKAKIHPELIKIFEAFQEEIAQGSSGKRSREEKTLPPSASNKKPRTDKTQQDDDPVQVGAKRPANQYDERASKKSRGEQGPSLLPNPWALVEDSVIDTRFDLLNLQGEDPVKKEEAIRRVRDFIRTFDKENPSTLDLKDLQLQKLPIFFYTDPMFSHIEISGNSIATPQDLLIKDVLNSSLYEQVLSIQNSKEFNRPAPKDQVLQGSLLAEIFSYLSTKDGAEIRSTSKEFNHADILAEYARLHQEEPHFSEYLNTSEFSNNGKARFDSIKSAEKQCKLDQSLIAIFSIISRWLSTDIQRLAKKTLERTESPKEQARAIRRFLKRDSAQFESIPYRTLLPFKIPDFSCFPAEIKPIINYMQEVSLIHLFDEMLKELTLDLKTAGRKILSRTESPQAKTIAIRNFLKTNSDACATIRELSFHRVYMPLPPPEIGLFTRLETLRLDICSIQRLPDELGILPLLTTLDLSNNSDLSTLPRSMKNLKTLRNLNLMGNRFSDLPEWIGDLKSLQKLNLTHNRFFKLPTTINKLTQLQELDISRNNLRDLQSSDLPPNALIDARSNPIPEILYGTIRKNHPQPILLTDDDEYSSGNSGCIIS